MNRARENNINTAAYWDSIYLKEHSEGRSRMDDRRLREVLRWCQVRHEEVQRDPYILDVGCGLGELAQFMAEHQPGSTVAGIDISTTSIDICRRTSPKPAAPYRLASADAIPFPDEMFDIVWCGETLEHVDDPEKAISEMKRVTQDYGFIVISTPYRRRNTSEEHVWEYEPIDVIRWGTLCGELVFLDCLLLPSWLTMFAVFRKALRRTPS